MTHSRASHLAWLWLGILLSISVFWAQSFYFTVSIYAFLFVPLLTGWLASRYGPRVVRLLLALGLLSIFEIYLQLLDRISIRFTIPLYIWFLAIGTAVAFSRPRFAWAAACIYKGRWCWLKWLLPVSLWLAMSDADIFPWQITGSFEWTIADSFEIGTTPGFVLLLIVLAASVNWKEMLVYFQASFLDSERTFFSALLIGFAALLMLAFVCHFQWGVFNMLTLYVGFPYGDNIVPVIAFLLTVSGRVDWRLMLAFLVVFFFSNLVVTWIGKSLEANFSIVHIIPETPAEFIASDYSYYVDIQGMTSSISAALLAVAIAPFWHRQDPASVRTTRTGIFLVLALFVLFFGWWLPELYYGVHSGIGDVELMIVGGVAFIAGVIWQVRGIIAGPLIIQLFYLFALVVLCSGDNCHELAYEQVNIGMVAFPFAFFGYLSNRYQVKPTSAYVAVMQRDAS